MKKISAAQSSFVISLLHSGLSELKINKKTGVSLSTISRIRSKHCPDLPRQKGGHPSKLSHSNILYATKLFHMGKAENAVEATKTLSNITPKPFSPQTLRHGLKKLGWKAVVKQKRQQLKDPHKKARLAFAERYREWTVEDWKRVWFSDETKINRLGSDGRKYVWKESGEGLSDRLVEGTVKFREGNIMIWGCMGWEGIGYACRIEGKMDGELYESILEDELKNTLEYYDEDIQDIVFQQDNNPKHTCKRVKRWFENEEMEALEWPA